MKKAYAKPEILFDCFELAEGLTANCIAIQTNNARNVCPVTIPEWGMTVFTDASGCDIVGQGGNDKICYEIPAHSSTVFVS